MIKMEAVQNNKQEELMKRNLWEKMFGYDTPKYKTTKKDLVNALKCYLHVPSILAIFFGVIVLRGLNIDNLPKGVESVIFVLTIGIWILISLAWLSIKAQLNRIELELRGD